MTTSEAEVLLAVARRAAEAGARQLRHFDGKSFTVRSKGRLGDLITDADEAAEAAVLEVLRRDTPAVPVLAEESGRHGETGDLLWCVDPLDGTTNFAHGYPFFATSVGLLRQGKPWLGAVVVPRLEETFRGGVGLGAFCNDKPIRVSNRTTLARSVLVTGFAYDRHERLDNNYAEFCRFAHRVGGVRRGGAAAVDLAYVACGRLDGYWERGLKSWDLAAGAAILQGAGGRVCAYDGGPVDIHSGRILAACSVELQQQMSAVLVATRPLPLDCYAGEPS
ncbi:MAG: inositol monophosphatase [Synechococcus sp. SB0676_bin_10]|uniref:Inositol-1-monophosphatase n=1 Tax=Synechococcus sp. SB0676_bin_10 TaxID=2604869 RepID=A0A6B1FAQ6_9SYNE|nr:inositol monophosphatase family protein [Cyanobacteria bacterium MAG IRC3_bin_20]MDE0646981.1 inositol monophosphatase family protein [Cyanobacteria bacterium MAG IRC4_bin_6]MXY19258.1 inositol monophosphatase [Synechococcus sp. SB0664_bin_36]MYG38846.1 inositol monophosphatase [Synechococcus sp. SB0676_bin_10]MYG63327.1 inositol monophosphatase [Synechococcus sp. SB0675_bin_7]MYK85420.1 inositol monophosphatase [Synechococcus sp. SB0669_bin_7]